MNIKQVLQTKLGLSILLILPYLLDQTFQWITDQTGGFSLGFFGLELSHTPGFFLEHFYSASPELKSLYFFGIGFYLISLFILVYFVFLKRSLQIPYWVAFFLGGLLGYFLDGLTHSNIVYWFYLFGFQSSLSFIFMSVGCIGILVTSFQAISQQKKSEARKQIFVMDDQYNFCISIALTYIIYIISMGCFSYVFISNLMYTQINEMPTTASVQSLITRGLSFYLFLFIILSSILCIMFSFFIVNLSNKIYGPIYAFKKYIQEALISKKGSDRVFKLRRLDHFKFLEELAQQLKNSHKK